METFVARVGFQEEDREPELWLIDAETPGQARRVLEEELSRRFGRGGHHAYVVVRGWTIETPKGWLNHEG